MSAVAAVVAPARSTRRIDLLACVSASGLAFLAPSLVPWLTARLVADHGLSNTHAGLIGTLQLSLLAIFALGLGAVAHRLPLRPLACGCALLIAGLSTLLAVSTPSTVMLAAGLSLIGIAGGVCSAVASALLAASRDPAKQTADMWTGLMIWQAVLWFAAPRVVDRWGLSGLFGLQALNAALFLLPLFLVRPEKPAVPTASCSRAVLPPVPWPWLALALAGALGFWLRDALAWSLADRRAGILGVGAEEFSNALAAGAILGFLGPVAARWLGSRLGRVRTLAIALVPVAAITLTIASTQSAALYEGAFLLWSGTSIFAWTYLIELALKMDPLGRVAALCGGIVFAASATGPLLGALLLDRFAPTVLPQVNVALTTIVFVCALTLAHLVTCRKAEPCVSM